MKGDSRVAYAESVRGAWQYALTGWNASLRITDSYSHCPEESAWDRSLIYDENAKKRREPMMICIIGRLCRVVTGHALTRDIVFYVLIWISIKISGAKGQCFYEPGLEKL
jgi:hypothetical protein